MAKLASSRGGKPITDSIIEIKRGAEGVKSAIELIKNESGHVIPMNINKLLKTELLLLKKNQLELFLAISAFNHPFQSNNPSNNTCNSNGMPCYNKTS